MEKERTKNKYNPNTQSNQNNSDKDLISYRDLFYQNGAINLVISPDSGRIINANEAAEEFYGFSIEEMKEMSIYEINMLTVDEINKEMQLAKEDNRNYFIFKHRRKDGQIRDVEVHSNKVQINQKEVLFSTIFDITEKTDLENELKNKNFSLKKRISELNTLFKISNLTEEHGNDFNQIGQQLTEVIKNAFSFQMDVRIEIDSKTYKSSNFKTSELTHWHPINYHQKTLGKLELHYKSSNHFTTIDEEEKQFLSTVCERIGKIYHRIQLEQILKENNLILKERNEEILTQNEELSTINEELQNTNLNLYKAHQRLKENHKLFHNLFENLTIGVAIFNYRPDTNAFYLKNLNRSAERIENTSMAVCRKKRLVDLPITLNSQKILKGCREAYNQNKPQNISLQNFKDGKLQLHYECYILRTPTDEIVIIFEDITERKKAERALKKSEERYRTIFENSPLGIFRTLPDGTFLDINQAMANLFAYNHREEMMHHTNAIDFYQNKKQRTLILKKLQGRDVPLSFKGTFIKRSREEFNGRVIMKNNFNENNELLYIEGIIEDITLSEKVNKERLLNTKRQKSLLQIINYQPESTDELLSYSLQEILKLTESKYGFIYIKEEASDLYKLQVSFPENKVNNKVFYSTLKADTLNSEFWQTIHEEKTILKNTPSPEDKKHVYPWQQKDLHRWLTQIIEPENGSKILIGVANKSKFYTHEDVRQLQLHMNTLYKIIQQKQFEENLKIERDKAERSERLKSSFLANMSHEIRTPMNGIVGFSSLLATENNPEKRKMYTEVIQSRSNDLLRIIDDILDFSMIEANTLEIHKKDFELISFLEHLNMLYTTRKKEVGKDHIKLRLKQPEDINELHIHTDEGRLKQILTNLLENALKFTLQGEITFGCSLFEKKLYFYVEDTGIGIDKQSQSLIFSSFRQAEDSISRNFSGNGLGLAICKRLCQLLGGDIWVKSEKDKGSVFTFYIPLEKGIASLNMKNTEQIKLDKKIRVLAVEDDLFSAEFLREIFSRENIFLKVVTDGQSVLEEIEVNDYDLILMDIQLPDIDGTEVTEIIRSTGNQIPIVAQTAYAMESDKERCFKAGCNDYISKPVSKDKLLGIIQELVIKAN